MTRRVGSVKSELIKKSREAALAAVQIFNNPNITFKSESFIVLMIIAWTYLMHAYYRANNIEYRYFEQRGNQRRRFDKTRHGAYKHWDLERCLNEKKCPLDSDTKNNLRFLIGLRHEIEHQMTTKIDDVLSARFQACCLNYNDYVKKFFGEKYGIDTHLAFSLQFSTISMEQKDLLQDYPALPNNILVYISEFDNDLTESEFESERFSYRLLFVPKTVNRPGQADRVIEFVKSDSQLAAGINKEYQIIKETEKQKYLPKQVVDLIKSEGFTHFSMHQHTQLWKSMDAKNPSKGFGTMVASKTWHWYDSWIQVVRKHCQDNRSSYV